jgi:hypothetical protein
VSQGFWLARVVAQALIRWGAVSDRLRPVAPVWGGFTQFGSQICSQAIANIWGPWGPEPAGADASCIAHGRLLDTRRQDGSQSLSGAATRQLAAVMNPAASIDGIGVRAARREGLQGDAKCRADGLWAAEVPIGQRPQSYRSNSLTAVNDH